MGGRHRVGVLRVGSGCMALHRVRLRCAVASGVALCWVGLWRAVLHCVVSNCGAVHDACAKLIPVYAGEPGHRGHLKANPPYHPSNPLAGA